MSANKLLFWMPARGEGSWLWDTEGRRCIDFASGISALHVGHCHPRVVAAVQAQLERFLAKLPDHVVLVLDKLRPYTVTVSGATV